VGSHVASIGHVKSPRLILTPGNIISIEHRPRTFMARPDMKCGQDPQPVASSEDQGGLGPAENNPEPTSGAWRLLICPVLLALALAHPCLSPARLGRPRPLAPQTRL